MKNQKEYNLMMKQHAELDAILMKKHGYNKVPLFIIPMIEIDVTDPRYEQYFKDHPKTFRHPVIKIPEFTMDQMLEQWRKQNPSAPKLQTVISMPDNGRNPELMKKNSPVDFDAMRLNR